MTHEQWRICTCPLGEQPSSRRDAAELTVCYSSSQASNARLIAAAPELLAELINLVDAIDNGWSDPAVADKARAAIAKAKGE